MSKMYEFSHDVVKFIKMLSKNNGLVLNIVRKF